MHDRFIITLLLVFASAISAAQELPVATQQQLEALADAVQSETEDDSYLQLLEQYRHHPLDINAADAAEWRELQLLSDWQIDNLLSYRKLLGYFTSLYELQAIPGWDIMIIKRVLPFLTMGNAVPVASDMLQRLRKGKHSLIFRLSQVLEKAKAYTDAANGYRGSPQRIFLRYRYSYKNLLQAGITGDKDAGEQFFKGAQSSGFDFYSFHFFSRRMKRVQALALGDFTVNMGQGLIQWQSLAFKKSGDAMAIKRQSAVLRPYSSAGEFNFHRGAGVTLENKKTEWTIFASLRKLSANLVAAADTVAADDFFSSFLTSGNHRTAAEIADRHNLTQIAGGTALRYRSGRWQAGVNAVYYSFSNPLHKRNQPYNRYALTGKQWYNASFDYSATFRNLHFFGEAAVDKNYSTAFLNGLLISADRRVDIALLQRYLSKSYQSVGGNAFTESVAPSNETGWYMGIAIRPSTMLRIDGYADFYTFPWLRYRTDAPGRGNDFSVQLVYIPSRQAEIITRYRNEIKQGNQPGNATVLNYLTGVQRQSWRIHINYKLASAFTIRSRVEALWYNSGNKKQQETGALYFVDCLYKPLLKPLSAAVRLQYFESDSYNSRLYAYENDVLYRYSIPVIYGRGYRYYCLLAYDVTQKITAWLRYAQTIYPGQVSIGSGPDTIDNDQRTELRVQVQIVL